MLCIFASNAEIVVPSLGMSDSKVIDFDFASFAGAGERPGRTGFSSYPSNGKMSTFTDSTSSGVRFSNPLTLINSAAAFGYTVL